MTLCLIMLALTFGRTTPANAVPQPSKQSTVPSANPSRRSLDAKVRHEIISNVHQQGDMAPASPSSKAASSSPSSSSSSDIHVSQSRAFTRRPRFPPQKPKKHLGLLSSADEEASDGSDDTPAFLPVSNVDGPSHSMSHDPSATLRHLPSTSRKDPPSINTDRAPRSSVNSRPPSQNFPRATASGTKTSHSSSSSLSSPFPASNTQSRSISSPGPGPTSPPLPLSALSPRTRRIAREGSEGTPSMGSSFSDLDDASVTQSALEEALAREIREGGGSLGVVGRTVGGLWRTRGAGRGGGS
jgi:hypothetical protein